MLYACTPTAVLQMSTRKAAAQVAFVNGRAVFQLESIKLQAAIHKRLFEQLSEGVKLHKTFDEVRADLDPLPKGKLICCNKDVSDDSSELQGITYNGANYLVCVCQQ